MNDLRPALLLRSSGFVSVAASMSVRKSSHGTIFLIVSSGSPRALIASSLRSTSKKPFCPMTRSLHPPMTAHGHRVRFAATWREEFFEVPLRELIHLLGDFARYVERVRFQRLKDADARRGLAVEREDLAVGLRTQLDAADVAHVHHLPVRFGLDHDVLELADIVEAAGDVEGVLKSLRVRRRRHAELAGGDLLVLALERVDDVLGGQRTRVELVGIEPNPHRILAGPEDIDLAHARQARELGL